MSEIETIVNEYFDQHPIIPEQIVDGYIKNYKTKIIDDFTGKAFGLGMHDSKLYMKEKVILPQEVI